MKRVNKGKFTGVGLGPGDPELITVKGYRALRSADIIFYPVTAFEGGTENSWSAVILDKLEISKPCKPLLIPMNGRQREKYYREAFGQIKATLEKGKNVVMVSEGDLLFYSTFGYIFKMAREEGIPCQLIPGIPAFIAAGTLGVRPLAEKNTDIEVVARPESFAAVEEALNRRSTLVIMKISVLAGWHSFLKTCGRPFLYAERVGTENEFFTADAEELEFRRIPYFSLLIIYPESFNQI